MDASGEEALAQVVDRLRSAGLGFAMCGIKGQVMAVMERTGLIDKIGKENMFSDTGAAVKFIVATVHAGTDLPEEGCKNCPLTQFIPQ
jgi:MFS superfamily sulfate permease-like transporter